MTPSDVMAAQVEIEGSDDRARTLARVLKVEDENAIELIRRAFQAERYEAQQELREEEDW